MSGQVYIGLLRGINVGGKVLTMKALTAAIADLGLVDVRTYLQSGNLLFRTTDTAGDTLAARVSEAIEAASGLNVDVLIRSAAEWDAVVAGNPFPQAASQPKTLHAFILARQPVAARVDALRAEEFGSEQWRIVGAALYLHTPDGFGKSRLANSMERRLKVPMTGRNWNTVLALQNLATQL